MTIERKGLGQVLREARENNPRLPGSTLKESQLHRQHLTDEELGNGKSSQWTGTQTGFSQALGSYKPEAGDLTRLYT